MPPDRDGDSPSREGQGESGERREVIFEYVPIGSSVKVTAVDVASGLEVSVVGPSIAAPRELERVAVQKLRYMLEKKKNEGAARGKDEPGPAGGTGGGIVV
ncbi:MAG: hypothetical protein U0942_11240 [Parvibaculum sp.]|uniref:DUF6898 family protein n=1 Tax=Parvibaculum sp. TaxID=2024848 RepID=UPI002ABB8A21|nr:hypothetical protein [Parvibaculum sp.]MDZ4381904.1 hypothetical protein [Parvibaculum sp.]